MDWLKTLIDALALLRYNELQLYTEHTFAYAEHAAVWEHASPMTAAEIREIDAYCQKRRHRTGAQPKFLCAFGALAAARCLQASGGMSGRL